MDFLEKANFLQSVFGESDGVAKFRVHDINNSLYEGECDVNSNKNIKYHLVMFISEEMDVGCYGSISRWEVHKDKLILKVYSNMVHSFEVEALNDEAENMILGSLYDQLQSNKARF